MNMILKGLLKINNIDVYERYGVFLAEEKKGRTDNYTALTTYPSAKGTVGVDFREDNGVKLPKNLDIKMQPRDVTLQFGIIEQNLPKCVAKMNDFLQSLMGGYMNFYLTELGTTYKMIYKKAMPPKFITGDETAVLFKVQFWEPIPEFK